ncbi:hypothetical protein LT330_004243 [Penicillium expansum]|nr:hypothetical protein LT330_004243 [Penicillium expansum]
MPPDFLPVNPSSGRPETTDEDTPRTVHDSEDLLSAEDPEEYILDEEIIALYDGEGEPSIRPRSKGKEKNMGEGHTDSESDEESEEDDSEVEGSVSSIDSAHGPPQPSMTRESLREDPLRYRRITTQRKKRKDENSSSFSEEEIPAYPVHEDSETAADIIQQTTPIQSDTVNTHNTPVTSPSANVVPTDPDIPPKPRRKDGSKSVPGENPPSNTTRRTTPNPVRREPVTPKKTTDAQIPISSPPGDRSAKGVKRSRLIARSPEQELKRARARAYALDYFDLHYRLRLSESPLSLRVDAYERQAIREEMGRREDTMEGLGVARDEPTPDDQKRQETDQLLINMSTRWLQIHLEYITGGSKAYNDYQKEALTREFESRPDSEKTMEDITDSDDGEI